MEKARKIGGIAGNKSQRAFAIESLETVEQLPRNFQVWFHSKTDQHEFIDFFRRANGECCRSDAGDRKIGPAHCSLCGGGLSFPHRQAANRALLEILIVRHCANDLSKSTTGLDEVELASLTRFGRGERAGDARRVARWMQARDGGGWADQSRPKFWLLVAPALCEVRAFELIGVNRKDRVGFLW